MSDIKSDRVLVCESAMSAAREMVKMAEQGSVVAFAVAVVIDDGDKIFHSYDYDNRAKHSSLELLGVIEVLKAHVLKMTWGDARIIGPEEEEEEPVRPAAVLSLARGASRDACGCCRKCGASVPCVAITNGEGCEGQCFCGTQEDDLP
jgi:hypothetical protein